MTELATATATTPSIDASGLWKEIAGQRIYYAYTNDGLVGEYSHAGEFLQGYGYRPGSPWSSNPLWLQQNGQYHYFHNDDFGAPQRLIDASGRVVWATLYIEAYGRAPPTPASTIDNPLRYAGRYADPESGLI